MERIRSQVESCRFPTGDAGSIVATISCGVAALCPQRHEDLETAAESLLLAADTALLRAKGEGRNRVVQAVSPTPEGDYGSSAETRPGPR